MSKSLRTATVDTRCTGKQPTNVTPSVWKSLEALAAGYQVNTSLAAVPATWRELAGSHYDGMLKGLLRTTGETAHSYPCPQGCGCAHEIIRHDRGRIVAVCRCDPWNCDDIPLEPADTVLVELNWPKLGRAIASALDCDVANCTALGAGTRQVATFGGAGLPVVLTIQQDRAGFAGVVAQLVATLKERFILLAPTNRFYDAHSQALLKGARAGFFALESHLELLPTGRLYAARRAGELFAPFLPEQTGVVKEAKSKLVFRLFGELMSLGTHLKAPPAQVFDLMILKKLTHAETAVACKCAPSLITRRVGVIEGHFQMTMLELLDFASDLKERQTTVKADKYAKKKHGSPQIDAQEPDDDQDDDSPPPEEYRYEAGGQND